MSILSSQAEDAQSMQKIGKHLGRGRAIRRGKWARHAVQGSTSAITRNAI